MLRPTGFLLSPAGLVLSLSARLIAAQEAARPEDTLSLTPGLGSGRTRVRRSWCKYSELTPWALMPPGCSEASLMIHVTKVYMTDVRGRVFIPGSHIHIQILDLQVARSVLGSL